MSAFLCFICHNTVHSDTNTETREKYKELIGMKLCLDSHLCHICCHLLRKLWLFKSICLRRSMEYPILFSDKGTVNLQSSNVETAILCPDAEQCEQRAHATYHFTDNDNIDASQYVSLEDNIDLDIENTEENKEKDNHSITFNNEDDDINTDNGTQIDDDGLDTENDATKTAEENEETADSLAIESITKEELDKPIFYKVVLTLDEQKAELEAKRREDKYLEAEFKCYNCAMGFLFKDTYQAHMMRHEESNGEHVCPVCWLRFASGRVARAHAQAHAERRACARCGRAVRRARLAEHARRCGPAPAPAPARCRLCGATVTDASALQQHIKRSHLSKTSNKTYCCHVCGKSYNNQAAVRTHMIKHINKKFTCDQCPSTFSSPYTLAQHRKSHGPRQQHACATCRVCYDSRKSLLAHLRNAVCHQNTFFVCPICSRNCANQRSLTSHMQTVHTTEKPFACPQCPARYTSKKSLGDHLRSHRGAKPKVCVCHICGASFKGNSKLNRHLRGVCEKNKIEELAEFYNQE